MGQTYSFWPILPKSGIHACIKLFGILGGGGSGGSPGGGGWGGGGLGGLNPPPPPPWAAK